MGLGFVLFFWLIVGLVAATVGALFFSGVGTHLTRGATAGRKLFITAATAFPFVCLAWAGAVFVFQAVVNEAFLDRDLGIGDGWHAPLPNGYQVMFIDVTDHGTVYNPKTQGGMGSVFATPDSQDAVRDVRALQVAGQYILGSRVHFKDGAATEELNPIDAYFILDTRAVTRNSFQRMEQLQSAAKKRGITVNLEPIYDVYSRYRFTWFDVVAGLLFVIPPLAGFVILMVWLRRVRNTRFVHA